MVVASFLGVGLVTHYAIAGRVAQLFVDLMIWGLGVFGPVFMRVDALGDRARAREIFLLTTRLSVIVSVTAAGGILIVGQRFIELWVGDAYRDAYWPLVILTGSLAVGLMQMPSVSLLYATARHRFYAYLNTAEALANLCLSVILVQFYGMIGVSLGTALPILFTKLVLQPRYVCGTLGLDLHAYYRELFRIAFISAFALLPLFLYVDVLGIPSLPLLVGILVGYYPFCWLLLVCTVLPKPDRHHLQQVIPDWRRSFAMIYKLVTST